MSAFTRGSVQGRYNSNAIFEVDSLRIYGSPTNEYRAIQWCAAKVRKFRNLFGELGMHDIDIIENPTKLYVDNNVAIERENV